MKTLQQSIQGSLLCLIAILLCTSLAAQTSLRGNVSDKESGEAILFGNVAIFKNGVLVTGVETDFDGNYNITSLDAGTYDVEVRYIGYQTHRITGVPILVNKPNKLDIKIKSSSNLEDLGLVSVYVPHMRQDSIVISTEGGGIVTADQIKTLPTKNINGLAAMTCCVNPKVDQNQLTVGYGRCKPSEYYIDGIKERSNPIAGINLSTFTLAILAQTASSNSVVIDFIIAEKGNINIRLANSRNEIIHNRTIFMDKGNETVQIDFMNTGSMTEIYNLMIRYENGFQENRTITLP